MDLIDLTGVEQTEPEFYKGMIESCKVKDSGKKTSKKSDKQVEEDMKKSKSTVSRLGNWVKNAVNCCIE